MHERTLGTASSAGTSLRRKMLFGAIGLLVAGCHKSTPVSFNSLDITGAGFARNFQLNDPDGHPRTLRDFSGKAVLIFFGITQCPDV